MSSTAVSSETSVPTPGVQPSEMKLEVVNLPVADIDRAKSFYQKLGWRLDGDFAVGDDFRVVQFTPPGSLCSITFGEGVTEAAPGAVQDLMLSVYDVEQARADLLDRGIEVSKVFHYDGGLFHRAGAEGRTSGPDPEGRSYFTWASFSDPDGNGWLLQEIKARLPGR